MKVLARIYSPEEINALLSKYDNARFGLRSSNRKENFSKPITPDEVEALKFFFQDTDTSIKVKAHQLGIKTSELQHRVRRATNKVIFQNGLDKI